MPSIKQLAQRLNVSIGTVSRALNDRPGVNPQTRARVQRAAAEIGYVANASGRSLRRGRTTTIGLVIETDNAAALGGDNFFISLADAMQGPLAARGYDLVILPCRRADDPVEFLRRVVRRGIVDAVAISATRRQDPRIEMLLASGLPFLALGRSETPGDYAWIDLDFERIARDSVARLAALGHRRIAVVLPEGDANLAAIYRRAAAASLRERGLDADAALTTTVEASEQGGNEAARRLLALRDPPTAAMSCSEPLVQGLYAGLGRAGLRAGRDLSVIGFRDTPQLRYLDPPPSSFVLEFEPLGAAMAEAITGLAARTEPEEPPPIRLIWPMAFRETASIGPPPDPG